jgi:hypothetical protein
MDGVVWHRSFKGRSGSIMMWVGLMVFAIGLAALLSGIAVALLFLTLKDLTNRWSQRLALRLPSPKTDRSHARDLTVRGRFKDTVPGCGGRQRMAWWIGFVREKRASVHLAIRSGNMVRGDLPVPAFPRVRHASPGSPLHCVDTSAVYFRFGSVFAVHL